MRADEFRTPPDAFHPPPSFRSPFLVPLVFCFLLYSFYCLPTWQGWNSNLHRPGETATCRARGFTERNSDWWVYCVISDGFALWKEWLGLFDRKELSISFISSISRDLHQDITMDLRYLSYSCLVSSYLKWIQFSIIFMLTTTTFYLSLRVVKSRWFLIKLVQETRSESELYLLKLIHTV